MKKRSVIILTIIILLALIAGYFAFRPIKMTGNVIGDLQVSSIQDLGKWIDARQQGSYYAGFNSIIRDDSGRIHITYCSSGEPYNQNYAPDWRDNANYSTDKVRSQYSSNNGSSWFNSNIIVKPITENNSWQYNPSWKISRNWGSDGGFWEYDNSYNAWIWYQKNSSNNLGTGWRTIMRAQENTYQGACTNSIVYFNGYYYLYFESYSSPSGILAIHVARSSNPQGPYEVFTDDGWKTIPTNSRWKPVLETNLRSVNGGEEWFSSNYRATNWSSQYWGAGLPRVTQKDGQIYLYFVDATYWIIYNDAEGKLKEYGRLPNQAIPYTLLAISSDPTKFENKYANRLVNSSGSELWNSFNPKYFPEENKFYNFYFKNINGENKVVYQTSSDGIIWNEEKILGNAPEGLTIAFNNPEMRNNIQETYNGLGLLSDKNGYGKLSDLYLTYSKEYILPNAPVGWMDTPNYKWYYGGTDIYGLKINLDLNQNNLTVNNSNKTLNLSNDTSLNNQTNLSNSSNNFQDKINQTQNISDQSSQSTDTNSNYPPASQYMPPVIDQSVNDSSKNWTKAIDISETKVSFFKKFFCKLFNLFNRQGYETCIAK